MTTDKKPEYQALLNNTADDNEAILLERELAGEEVKSMDTKKAVEIVKIIMDFFIFPASARIISGKVAERYRQKRDDIIALLKRGEKYEKMWGKLKKEFEDCELLNNDYYNPKNSLYEDLEINMEEIEQ